jgi:hypothetical protein
MIQRGNGSGFLLETAQAILIPRQCLRQDFDGDVAVEARVAGAVDPPVPPAPRSD